MLKSITIQKLLLSFADRKVKFLVIGARAFPAYGYVRNTFDTKTIFYIICKTPVVKMKPISNFNFIIEKNKERSVGRFIWHETFNKMFALLNRASDFYETGEIEKALSKFRYLVKKDPTFFPALNNIGWCFIEKRNFIKALDYFQKAVHLAENKIPDNFNGTISWEHFDNRHYLRTLQGLALTYANLLMYKESLNPYKRILQYNPKDDQNIRYMIGDLYFLTGDLLKAESSFKNVLENSAVRYSYGLLLFNQKKYTDAIIHLSHGIMDDQYTFTILLGEEIEEEFTNENASDIRKAYEYFQLTFDLWSNFTALNFLEQIYLSKTFNSLYKKITPLKNQLKNIYDSEKRENIINKINNTKALIDSEFASKIFNEIKAAEIIDL